MSNTTGSPRYLRGDEATVFRAYEQALRAAVRHTVTAPDEVIEDACAFAWLQFLRRQPDRDTVFAWLRVVATRCAWQLAARERRDVRYDATPGAFEKFSASTDDGRIRAREALQAVADLPDRQRRYAELHVAGHSYDEISAATGATRTNVNKHLTLARKALRNDA
jgi:RNA polymerase sigma factor (sigma-70 family)